MKSAVALVLAACTLWPASYAVAADDADPTKAAKVQLQELTTGLDMYYVDCSEYPEKLEAIIEKPKSCPTWGPQPYLTKIPNDPWGQPWLYTRKDPKTYEIKSLGADRREGGIGVNKDMLAKQFAPVLKKSSAGTKPPAIQQK